MHTLGSATIPIVSLSLVLSLNSADVLAQTVAANTTTEAPSEGLEEIVVTGTRQTGLKAADSAAPIQILSAEMLARTASQPDLIQTLAAIVSSLTAQAFGFDASNASLQARLCGLSPNHVLILIDGKRRHPTANLAVDAGAFQGGAGADLNFIPSAAIGRIEVLSEGAAAQYGSDAIAGVINIILKKDSAGGSLNASYGGYYDGGGITHDVSGNIGFEPWDGGYLYVVLVSGTLTEEKGCGGPAETITAGSAFTELPGVIHRVFNYGTEPVEIIVMAIVPPRYAGYQGTILVNGPRCDD